MSYRSQNNISHFLFKAGCPATIIIIALNVISFFSINTLRDNDPFHFLIFKTPEWLQHIWTPFTWFLVGAGHPINVLFAGFWMFWVGGSLERSWGTKTFLGFFLFASALMAITCWLGMLVTGIPLLFAGLSFALAAPTIAWCMLNPGETIRLYAIIPIPSRLLAWLTVIVVWYEAGPPINGIFALSSCLFAFWFVKMGRSLIAEWGFSTRAKAVTGRRGAPKLRLENFEQDRESVSPKYSLFSPVRWLRARREQKKLEALWNRSFKSPPDEKERKR